jgi:hypothetical protein
MSSKQHKFQDQITLQGLAHQKGKDEQSCETPLFC